MAASRIKTLNKKEVCYKCNIEVSYSKIYDCYYCMKCHIWLEPKCDDLFCLFCKRRPARPQIDKIKVKSKKKTIEWKM